MQVVRNVMVDPRLVPGGGALEMALAQFLSEKSKVDRALVVPQKLCVRCVYVECCWSAAMAVQSPRQGTGSDSSYSDPELWSKHNQGAHSAQG